MDKIIAIIVAVIGIIVLLIGISLLLAWPFMLLWNGCLVGTVAGVSPLTRIWGRLGHPHSRLVPVQEYEQY